MFWSLACGFLDHNEQMKSTLCSTVDQSQAYHPLFVWWAVHLYWLCRFIKLAKLKPKFRSFKTEANEIKTHKIAAMVF